MNAHEQAVPRLHARLSDQRREAEKWHRIARTLAECLGAEVDLRHGERGDEAFVRSRSGYALGVARQEGLL